MDKGKLRAFAVFARDKLLNDFRNRAWELGISAEGVDQQKLQLSNIEGKDRLADVFRSRAQKHGKAAALDELITEAAYTWFNRLIAIRFMEVNGFLKVRVLSGAHGKAEPDIVTDPFRSDLDFSAAEKEKILDYMQNNASNELFRMLFVKQCRALARILPMLFDKEEDIYAPLLNLSFTDKDGVLWSLVHHIAECDWREAVEIVGWLYQYYNTEPKQAVFDGLKKNVKITKENIPAATQLFTPDWIVRYMVENSLGRLWLEGHPNAMLDGKPLRSRWKYYLDEAPQPQGVAVHRKKIESPEDIRLIDPCMGSGHILVYAFDVLHEIYRSAGYTVDIPKKIIENNLFGLDIDHRAFQLAYFALMMKARSEDRYFFENPAAPQVYSAKDDDELENFGSLLRVNDPGPRPDATEKDSLFGTYAARLRAWNYRRLLAQKYDCVVTNPPYMGGSGMNGKLSEFMKEQYPDGKSDMFAAFIEQCGELLKPCGYQAMITQHAWMFLSSYEKLRGKIMSRDIVNMAHLGPRAFEEIGGEVVQTTSFVLRRCHTPGFLATYVRLIDYLCQQAKEDAFLAGGDRYTACAKNFVKIPGSPVAYWVGEAVFDSFSKPILFGYSHSPSQNVTGNNNRFVRKHWELTADRIGGKDSWIFYAKGGGIRKWHGNLDDVVDWTPQARSIYQFGDGKHASQIINKDYWYRKGITWGLITSNIPSFRIMPEGATFDKGGSTLIVDESVYNFTLGLLNSKVYLLYAHVFNPTLNFQVKDVRQMPLILKNERTITSLVEQNISLSRADWDAFETSWDFKRHPLAKGRSIAEAYGLWEREAAERFEQLKANEEELNRIFIEIYGLADELTPEVEDKDVTVRRADLGREVRSFVSYAVGCLFGRYSLDVDGLAYAGGGWEAGKYASCTPVKDNVIPITSEEYFPEEDIVARFVAFVRTVYGAEALEENLRFIAAGLGTRGSHPREQIRTYFLNEFYKDHVKTYQKRPIYWLFDSGKRHGFKALIYLHRYAQDTVGRVNVDYLHRLQRVYDNEALRLREAIESETEARAINLARKQLEKLTAQQQEARDYAGRLAHLALSRRALDLDDGVKVNYEKLQTDRDGKKHAVLAKI